MFNELTYAIDEVLKTKTHAIVAISGFGGSGKTRLTDRLKEKYGVADKKVVHLDNLFAPQPWGESIFDDYDWGELMKLLKAAHSGKVLKYKGRGFFGERYPFHEILPSLLLVEGVRLLRPEVMQFYDLSVWINCPLDIAIERGKKRDRIDGADEQHISRWDTEWGPKDKKYFDTYHPDKVANFLYKDYE